VRFSYFKSSQSFEASLKPLDTKGFWRVQLIHATVPNIHPIYKIVTRIKVKNMEELDKLPKHLRKNLDLENFGMFHIISQNKLHPVVVMRDKRSDAKAHWCIQHRDSGYYFQILNEIIHYCIARKWVSAL